MCTPQETNTLSLHQFSVSGSALFCVVLQAAYIPGFGTVMFMECLDIDGEQLFLCFYVLRILPVFVTFNGTMILVSDI